MRSQIRLPMKKFGSCGKRIPGQVNFLNILHDFSFIFGIVWLTQRKKNLDKRFDRHLVRAITTPFQSSGGGQDS